MLTYVWIWVRMKFMFVCIWNCTNTFVGKQQPHSCATNRKQRAIPNPNLSVVVGVFVVLLVVGVFVVLLPRLSDIPVTNFLNGKI
jgi:hypothetical protein